MKSNLTTTVLALIEENNKLLEKVRELEKEILNLKTKVIYQENKLCY
jgi:hypothetical protein